MEKELIISEATKNNWIRLNVDENERKDKLSRRANKLYSAKNIIPVEYFKNKDNILTINNLILYINQMDIPIKQAVYNLALNLVFNKKLANLSSKNIISKNKYLKNILDEFKEYNLDKNLLEFSLPNDEKDILGIIYQCLQKEGHKNKKGSYYTPDRIIKKLLKDIKPNGIFIDPCCGTGSFLLTAAEKINNPENIYGIDFDEIACFISKINLILKYPDRIFEPKIYNYDFLSGPGELKNIKFDIIATNPPWGALNTGKYSKIFAEISSGESFSYFIVQSEKLLKRTGKCYFVLPESILNVAVHSDIRNFILNNFDINKIELLGKAFSGVLSDVVLIYLDKNKTNSSIEIHTKNGIKNINKSVYEKSENKNFSILDNVDACILDKIYSIEYKTLSNSLWGLGIVTGNNSKHIMNNSENAEKIYTGKQIKPYFIEQSDKYIIYDRKKFQQTAPDYIYRADEKLVYKFISKKFVFAYDDKQRLFLNSANILIPKIETHSVKTALAFLNSTVFQYIYKKKFNELKILKGNLLQMPFPVLDNKTREIIENLVNNYFNTKDSKILNNIDDIVFNCFKLNKKDIELIKSQPDGGLK